VSEFFPMVNALELELRTYDQQRARLEEEHPGKFVLIRGGEIAAIFDDFQSASEYAARRLQRRTYLIHGIGAERMRIPSGLLDGLAAMSADARAFRRQASMSSRIVHQQRPNSAGIRGQ
jgi:hypothetical protein